MCRLQFFTHKYYDLLFKSYTNVYKFVQCLNITDYILCIIYNHIVSNLRTLYCFSSCGRDIQNKAVHFIDVVVFFVLVHRIIEVTTVVLKRLCLRSGSGIISI